MAGLPVRAAMGTVLAQEQGTDGFNEYGIPENDASGHGGGDIWQFSPPYSVTGLV